MSEPMQAAQARKTLVEEGTSFKGALSSNCPVEVKGRVEGDVVAPALSVSATGSVHGKVKVGEMRSYGELAGEFDADVVQLSGSVKDNTIIRAKSLEVKLAPAEGKMQVVFGECRLEVGAEPARSELAPRHSETPARLSEAPGRSSEASKAPTAPLDGSIKSTGLDPVKAGSLPPPSGTNGA
jgi:cytoskeletal protein CcmA (bactofilin family)